MTATATAPLLRCFVALWPDTAARDAIARMVARAHERHPAARPMRAENLHLTLAFIGNLPQTAVRALQPQVDGVPVTPFIWTLDRVGMFRGAQVLWLGGGPCATLEELAAAVRALLDRTGVGYDRAPFVPHVTLLRKLPRTASLEAGALVSAIRWPVNAVRLVVSIPSSCGPRYRDAADTMTSR
ncbi:MAG: RNA 2',3'-cyclic phosphodiesterase [Burkholderiales bacterium]|nr:RNA 2',3'-cyclic phosphodiesterase [Burkholderiales bacterium]